MGKYRALYAVIAVLLLISIVLLVERCAKKDPKEYSDSAITVVNILQIEKDSIDIKSKVYESRIDGTLVKLKTITRDSVTKKDIKEATRWVQGYNYSLP